MDMLLFVYVSVQIHLYTHVHVHLHIYIQREKAEEAPTKMTVVVINGGPHHVQAVPVFLRSLAANTRPLSQSQTCDGQGGHLEQHLCP